MVRSDATMTFDRHSILYWPSHARGKLASKRRLPTLATRSRFLNQKHPDYLQRIQSN